MVMGMNRHGKGNKKAQNKRRKERSKNLPPKQAEKVELIDGNFSYYPVGYCWSHGAYLTQGLVNTHRCDKRKCKGFEKVVNADESDSEDESKLQGS